MNLQTPPEVADGGYWYVVPVVPDPELGGQTPGDVPGAGMCAWYGSTHVAVRTPDPVAGLPVDGNVAAVLAEAVANGSLLVGTAKPHGRIEGS